ncbi:MAG TPA: response regulator transcription factor [Solirubrobacteraceae bacterium]|jgi:two-component system nitrate/nitrite response regulator NarL
MVAAERITVYVADDHPVFRDAVARAASSRPELELVGTGADGRRALDDIRSLSPGVAVVDMRLPHMEGLEIVRAIRRDRIPTLVVMLSADSSRELVYDAVQLGAAAFLTKASTLDQICDAIVAVSRGETVLAPEVQSGLVRELRERDRPAPSLLSERESQVLILIAAGLSNPEIGQRLYISASTVKTYVKSLLDKLGVNDRAAAVAEAMRRGLIE